MAYTKTQTEKVLQEISEGRVVLTCAKHGYEAKRHIAPGGKVGGIIPPQPRGCKECFDAYFKSDYAITPPHMRAQRLEELEGIIHRMVEAVQKGTWDFQPDERPQIEFIRDGFDDEKQDYREDN